jgi:hypothetical protein
MRSGTQGGARKLALGWLVDGPSARYLRLSAVSNLLVAALPRCVTSCLRVDVSRKESSPNAKKINVIHTTEEEAGQRSSFSCFPNFLSSSLADGHWKAMIETGSRGSGITTRVFIASAMKPAVSALRSGDGAG